MPSWLSFHTYLFLFHSLLLDYFLMKLIVFLEKTHSLITWPQFQEKEKRTPHMCYFTKRDERFQTGQWQSRTWRFHKRISNLFNSALLVLSSIERILIMHICLVRFSLFPERKVSNWCLFSRWWCQSSSFGHFFLNDSK